MATHSSVLAWRIPGTGEPGGLQSMGSHSQTRLKRLSSSSSNIPVCMCHIFFILSAVNRHFTCFHLFAIVNSVVVNMTLQISSKPYFQLFGI